MTVIGNLVQGSKRGLRVLIVASGLVYAVLTLQFSLLRWLRSPTLINLEQRSSRDIAFRVLTLLAIRLGRFYALAMACDRETSCCCESMSIIVESRPGVRMALPVQSPWARECE